MQKIKSKLKRYYGRAPLRISFAGGGTDLTEVFEKYGGAVTNVTIDKYIDGVIEKRNDKNILINGVPLELSDSFTKRFVEFIKPDIGFNFWFYNEIQPGRGLGSSSTYAVLLTSLLSVLKGEQPDRSDIINKVYNFERNLTMCGWQDQCAAVGGGFNHITFSKDKLIIEKLTIEKSVAQKLEQSLVLVYTNKQHDSGKVQKKNKGNIDEKKAEKLIEYATDIKRYLKDGTLLDIGFTLHNTWMLKRSRATTNKDIDRLYKFGTDNGAYGGKLLGAGDGGYMMFFVSPTNKRSLVEKLKHRGFEILDVHFSYEGIEIWE